MQKKIFDRKKIRLMRKMPDSFFSRWLGLMINDSEKDLMSKIFGQCRDRHMLFFQDGWD